jgi:hypothetical protein
MERGTKRRLYSTELGGSDIGWGPMPISQVAPVPTID